MESIFSKLISVVGIAIFVGICIMLSSDRARIKTRVVTWGLGLQFILAVLVLGVPELRIPAILRPVFVVATDFVNAMLTFTNRGTQFLFGSFTEEQHGFVFALQALPTIIFLSSLIAVLYHLGIMQIIVHGFATVMYKTMRISGAESLAASANIFVGQSEAPLMIRPFVSGMTRSELFCVMVGGMTTVAGGVLAVYVSLLQGFIPDIAGHLLTASVLSAPAAIMIAKLLIPEDATPETLEGIPGKVKEKVDSNVIEAAARGASEGLTLAFNIAAMLLAFIALVFMIDTMLGIVSGWIGFNTWGSVLVSELLYVEGKAQLSLAVILSWLFAPMAWLMGIPWSEALSAGALLGEKVAINEFVAYVHLAEIGEQLSERTVLILSYALCGFANFSSIAIQVGGIGGMAPERRSDLAMLGIKAVVGGSLAAFITACIANIFL